MNKHFIYIATSILLVGLLSACEEHIKNLPDSEIFTNMDDTGYEVKVNDTILLSPKITYDINSKYFWVLNGDTVWEEKDLQLIPKTLKKYNYTFKLKNRTSLEVNIPVQSMYKTDFEEIELEVDTFDTNATNTNSFVSDQIIFDLKGNYTADTWVGFTTSNMNGNNKEDDYEKYSSLNKPKNFESKVFGVMLLDPSGEYISMRTKDGEDHLFKSIDIINSYYLYNAIKNGSYGFTAFNANNNNWLKLTITGFDKNGVKKGSVFKLLADYTSDSNRNNTIIDNWTTISLEGIGKVSRLEFVLTSSETEDGLLTIPPYVCFDEIKIIE